MFNAAQISSWKWETLSVFHCIFEYRGITGRPNCEVVQVVDMAVAEET